MMRLTIVPAQASAPNALDMAKSSRLRKTEQVARAHGRRSCKFEKQQKKLLGEGKKINGHAKK